MIKMNKEGKEVTSYNYFDTPDGCDVFKKLWVVLKPTSLVALGISTVDVMCYSHPKGYLNTLGRYAYIGLPIIGISTAFVVTTNMSASIRKKDDKLNWFLGGFTAGSVYGIWRKSPMVGFNIGMFLGIAAILKKTAVDNCWVISPGNDISIANGGVWSVNQDWSLTAERPRNWVTRKEN